MGGLLGAEKTNGTEMSNGDHGGVPIALLFGTEDSPVKHVISGDLLQKLPAATISKLLATGTSIGGDGVKVHQLGGTIWCDALVRTQQYLDHKSYQPFNPAVALSTVDASNVATKWSAQSSAKQTSSSVRTSDATHGLFLKEIELYHFAKLFDFPELREHASMKLRTGYPIFARETMALLERLYRVAVDLKDEPLVAFIKASMDKHRDSVISHPEYVQLLRQSAIRDPLVQLLLEAQAASIRVAEADRLLSSIPATTTTKQETKPALKQVPEHHPHLVHQIYQALKNERLVVAVNDGYGTLLEGNENVRNRDFKFSRSELLLVDYSRAAVHGRSNVTVENGRGQRGDILATLVRVVPFGLGVTDEVNCSSGKATSLDREERKYSTTDRRRSRSRSPARG